MREMKKYSEAFKLQVVHAIESGKYSSCHEASIVYGIRGCSTVHNWVREYGKNHLIGKVVRVETADERQEIRRLKEENKKLKSALADTHIDLRLEHEFLKYACEKMGTDINEFKKKAGMKYPIG